MGGRFCARCHEIRPAFDQWHASTHRGIECRECHGGILTLDMAFHANNLHQLVRHLKGDVPDRVQLKQRSIAGIMDNCRRCHEQAFAQWSAGPHSATYQRIFTDPEHNSKRLLTDNCLRCHGMHYEGGIRDLIHPVSTSGPWEMLDAEIAVQPSIPCLTCHRIHTSGEMMQEAVTTENERGKETNRPSLAFFERRDTMSWAVELLPLPEIKDGTRTVQVSPDARQGLCYQCHAPLSSFQAGSSDDRTCIGVHEGISCLACHQKHGMSARASCKTCHPQLSNCGLDVENMDTTFSNPASTHNIHFVKCVDCHRG
jgi:hypothetical protein